MMKKLKDICEIQYGYAFDSKCFTDDSAYPQLARIRDVKRGYSDTYYSGEYSDEYVLSSGDLLVGMDGEFNISKWMCDGALLNQRVCKLIPKSGINKEYLRFAMSKALKEIENRTSFVTVKHLSAKELNKLELIIPIVEKQNNIADSLVKLENIINKRQQELDKLDELVKARFVEMFNCCDLAEQKEDWQPISKIGTIISGSTPKTTIAEYWDGEYRWITPAEIDNEAGYIYDSQRKITLDGAKSCSLTELPIDTVLLTSRAPIGKVALAGNTFFCNQGFKNIVCNNRINPLFLYTLLRLNTDYLNSLGRGATFKEISKKIVENIKIPVPSMDLQNQFSTFVKQIDKSKVAVQKALDKT